jgi:hypothetical protein
MTTIRWRVKSNSVKFENYKYKWIKKHHYQIKNNVKKK